MSRQYTTGTVTAAKITAATADVSRQVNGTKKYIRVTFTGTYTGLVGTVQGSQTGAAGSYVDIYGIREDTRAKFNGTVGSTNFSVFVSVGGWQYVQFKPTVCTSGTATVDIDEVASYEDPGIAAIDIASIANTLTSASANALAVGPAGSTNPSFNVDASAGSAATGWGVTAAAAASGAALAVISSGANENGTINAKGSGTLTLNGVATGAISLARATTVTGTLGVTGATTVTSADASALTVGLAGATNPALQVDASTGSSATGLKLTSAAAGGGFAVTVISSGANENLTVNAKGSGTVTIGGVSTGGVLIGANAKTVLSGALTAGGLLTCALQVATSGPLIYSGSGAPTISAAVKGSLYLRSDGSATNNRAYIATDSAGTWTALTTAA